MLNAVERAAESLAVEPNLYRVGSLLLLAWDLPGPLATAPSLTSDGKASPAPCCTLRLGLKNGGTRLLIAFRCRAEEGIRLRVTATIGLEAVIDFDPTIPPDELSPERLVSGIQPSAKPTLVGALVGMWPSAFRLGKDASYAQFVRRTLLQASGKPRPAQLNARVLDEFALVETSVPGKAGAIREIHVVGRAGVKRLVVKAHIALAGKDGLRRLVCLVETGALSAGSLLVLTCETGLMVRHLSVLPSTASLQRWWKTACAKEPLRSWFVSEVSACSEAGRALAIEMQLRAPLAAQQLRLDGMPSAEIRVALNTSAGLLVGGWQRDPSNLVEGLDLLDPSGQPLSLEAALHRFPGLIEERAGEAPKPASGFVAFLPDFAGGAPNLQPHFRLRLRSGSHVILRPSLQPHEPSAMRALALGAVPAQYVSPTLLESCFARPIEAMQARLQAAIGSPSIRIFGSPIAKPAASIVIPLYRVLDFLHCQVASFALDPWISTNCEVIFVLDSPEQAAEAEHLLEGLYRVYALPMALVVMNRNGGFSSACNAGAAIARGAAIAFVNSDVIPTANGWLETLISRLKCSGIGAVGPKLLFDDGSLQHAGLYFVRNSQGGWLNNHFYKGMPEGYPAANVERLVPAVTGACIVLRRSIFEELGGFCSAYVIGDYEDSDLCLRIRHAGHQIAYVPSARLYHLERRSIVQSRDYVCGIASRYNAWLHSVRWDDAIQQIMSTYETTDDQRGLAA